LLQEKWADARLLSTWREEATQKVEEAVAIVQREPAPDPYQENWTALASPHLNDSFNKQ
jgi:hypothetical protein